VVELFIAFVSIRREGQWVLVAPRLPIFYSKNHKETREMSSHLYNEVNCRVCGGELKTVFDLGEFYPSAFLDGDPTPFTEKVPLILGQCKSCDLVQLKHTVDLNAMYRSYFYRSSLNQSMQKALFDVARSAMLNARLGSGDIVVDIAANDGTLLSYYAPYDLKRVGFDPALNVAEDAIRHCDLFVNDYFTDANYPYKQKAKIITSIAMFYDLPDPCGFVQGVKSILHDDGIWILQLTDLTSMLKINAFDSICHEHLEYYTLTWLVEFLSTFSLDTFRVEYNQVNGGSVRLYICHTGQREIQTSVHDQLRSEQIYLESFEDPLIAFKERIYSAQLKVVHKLIDFQWNGITIYGMAASTKGNTLLQAWGIDNTLIPKIADVNPDKFGRKTIGTEIQIISDEQALEENPDTFFILAWHFVDFFLDKYQSYLQLGGRFMVPLPEPRIYGWNPLSGKIEWESI